MENLSTILAFGGNSRAARSARARLQWRDRFGRFIDMGRGIKFKLNLKGFNSPVSVIGKFVGSTNDPEYGQVYVSGDKNGLPDGFYNVKSSNAAEILATLDPNALQRAGIQLGRHADGTPVSSREAEEIQDADSIPYSPYPEGWTKQANGNIGTDDGSFYVQDAGKSNGYALYHNNQFVGYYNHSDWPGILAKSNDLDAEEEKGDSAEPTDHIADAKAAVAPFDDDKGTAAKMIDDGKSSQDVLAHLKQNSDAYQRLQNYPPQSRSGVMSPQMKQAQRTDNDIRAKVARANIAKNHGNDRQLISNDNIAVPTVPNKSNDGNQYGVTLHDGSLHNMNKTEHDIYSARRNLAVAQRNKNAPAIQKAQDDLDRLEADAGIAKPLQTNTPSPKPDADNTAPATTPATPSAQGPSRNNVPLVPNVAHTDNPAPYVLDPKPYTPTGQDDDPERIAKDFTQTDLQSALSQAVASGNSHVRLRHSTGNTANVPAEAIRDAIQRQGSDTNVDLDSDVTINTTAEFDALQEGDQVEYRGELFTKDDKGRWAIERNGVKSSFPNMMYWANLSGEKVVLKKSAAKQATPAPSAPTPTPTPDDVPDAQTPSVNAPQAQFQRKPARLLLPGDEIGNGTVISVSRGTRTPNGRVDVTYRTPSGVVRRGTWGANTQIGLVNRPQRPTTDTNTPAAPTPAPAAPSAPQTPPGAVRTPGSKPYDGSNKKPSRTDGRIGWKPTNPAVISQARSLLATRIHPTDDPRFDEAVQRMFDHGNEVNEGEAAYVTNALRSAPKATRAQVDAQYAAMQTRRANAKPVQTPQAATPTPQTQAPTPTPNTPPPPSTPVSDLGDDDEDIFDPNLVMEAIQRKYPNGKELSNGDYLVESRTVTGAKGAQLQYDTIITRTSNEYFYVYMRETNLTTGQARSQRVGPMVHSAKALNNRVIAANRILNAKTPPNRWFNSKRRRPNIKDDEFNAATGEFEHVKEQPILDSTINAIFKATNDSHISEDLIRDVFDTISRFGTSDATLSVIRTQHSLSRGQLNDLIDNINAKVSEQDALSKFQTWVSADGVTPLSEGDVVRHFSKTFGWRVGTVQMRIVDHDSKGYEYSDYVFVQFHNAQGNPVGKYTNLTSRNITLLQTTDGTDGSERVGPNARQLPQPTLSTRAQNRKNAIQAALRAHRQRAQGATPNQQVPVTRTPTGNSITLPNGQTAPMNLTRHHITDSDTSVEKTADQLVPGDKVQIFDPNTGKPRLAQVIAVTPDADDDTNVTVTAAVPDDNDSNAATVVNTYIPGSNGPTLQALYEKYAKGSDDSDHVAAAEDIDRLQDAFTSADITQMDPTLRQQVNFQLLYFNLSGNRTDTSKKEIDDLIAKLQASPQRTPPTAAQNLAAVINVAQSVADDNDDTGLQNSINTATLTSDRVSTPQGVVQQIIAENADVHDLNAYSKYAIAAGSNTGGFYSDAGGRKIYLKEQDDQAHADNEALASALYRAAGINSVAVLRGTHQDIDQPITFSRLVNLSGNQSLSTVIQDPNRRSELTRAFAVDAWLANWDSTHNNNIGVDANGKPIHIDVGGAIQFRAQGQPRTNFGDDVDELDTLRNRQVNSQAAAVYGKMTPQEQADSARQLLNISDSDIDTLVSSITKTSLNPQQQQALATTLKNRRKFILDKYNIDANTANTTAPQAQAPQQPAPAPAPATPPALKPNVPVINVPTLQDAQGVHYPAQPLSYAQLQSLRRGTAQPPVLPFKTKNTNAGEVHYYDTTGTRRWGQYGAAGAMLRRQRADGTYEYLLAQRASTLSTGANQWSVPSGAHDTLADSTQPGLTAGRELDEELGIDPSTVSYAGDYTSQPAPDWAFNYSIYDVKPGDYDTPPRVDPSEIQATRWVSQDEMRQMFDDGELHSSIDQNIFDGIHNTSANLPSKAPGAPTAPAAPTPSTNLAPSAPLPTPANFTPIPDGQQVDAAWINSAPAGQTAHFVNPLTRQPVELTRLNNGSWTNGTRVFTSQGLANLTAGRAPVLAGSIPEPPKAPERAPGDGQKATRAWIDSAPTGATAHFTSSTGETYNITKRDDGAWDVENPVNGYPPVRKEASIQSMAANGGITTGRKPDSPAPAAVAPPPEPSDAQVGLDNLLTTADPDNRLSAAVRLAGRSDEQLDEIYDEIHAKTRNRRALTDDEITEIAQKYTPKTPETFEDYFDRFDELSARVQELYAAAGRNPDGSPTSTLNLPNEHANFALAALTEMKGFNGKPTVVTTHQKLGPVKIYRGMKNISSYRSSEDYKAADMAEQFRSGDLQYGGGGIYGDGTYFSTNQTTADQYAGKSTSRYSNKGNGVVITAGLDPANANFKETKDDDKLFNELKTDFQARLSAYVQSKGFAVGSPEYKALYDKMEALFSQKAEYYAYGSGPHYDLGTLLLMSGYDGLKISQWSGEAYYIVYNRGILNILNRDKAV